MSAELLKTVLVWAVKNPNVPRIALEDALAGIIDLLPDHEASIEPDLKSGAVADAIVNAILSHPASKSLPLRPGARGGARGQVEEREGE